MIPKTFETALRAFPKSAPAAKAKPACYAPPWITNTAIKKAVGVIEGIPVIGSTEFFMIKPPK